MVRARHQYLYAFGVSLFRHHTGSSMDTDTRLSSVVGQLLFGYLADRYGRTRLYGIELVLVIVSTIGVATSSYGYGNMSFLALFTWVCFPTNTGLPGSADCFPVALRHGRW